MKINLVLAPFNDPSLIPLGIAQIKGYLKMTHPKLDVTCFDLNNSFYNNLSDISFFSKLSEIYTICPFTDCQNKDLFDYNNFIKYYNYLYSHDITANIDKYSDNFFI